MWAIRNVQTTKKYRPYQKHSVIFWSYYLSMKYTIPNVVVPEITEDEYWNMKSKEKEVIPLKKTCIDCAITTGFYIEMADSLKKQPKYIQEKVSNTWFCHNSCNRGCAGIRLYLQT